MKPGFPPAVEPVSRLIEELGKLPGVGPKSAARLAYHVLRISDGEARALADAIIAVKDETVCCSSCQNIASTNPCSICANLERDHSLICVVKEPLDVLAMERTNHFRGVYHVLHGVLSPMDGIGPNDLKIRELMARMEGGTIGEVIVATNPNLEGEATAMYLQRLLAPLGVTVTRLARGLPVGGDIEYADEMTLTYALESRRPM